MTDDEFLRRVSCCVTDCGLRTKPLLEALAAARADEREATRWVQERNEELSRELFVLKENSMDMIAALHREVKDLRAQLDAAREDERERCADVARALSIDGVKIAEAIYALSTVIKKEP